LTDRPLPNVNGQSDMADIETQARSATDKLLPADVGALYVELGKRLREVRRNPGSSSAFDMTAESALETMGGDQLREFGRQFFNRMNKQAYALMCGADSQNSSERDSLLKAFGFGKDAVAPALTALLVVQLGLAPAIATVLAVLAVKLFFEPGYDAMCDAWKKGLPQ
jgi:hypothetical protein